MITLALWSCSEAELDMIIARALCIDDTGCRHTDQAVNNFIAYAMAVESVRILTFA